MEGVQSDKVNINLGGSDGGGGGGNAAMIAALLNGRNQDGGGMAAMLPALMSGNNNGMNSMWPILLLALLGRGRGVLGGDGDAAVAAAGINPGQAALLQTILETVGATRAAVPQVALETQIATTNAIGTQSLANQQGFSNVKDSVQGGIALTLGALSGVKDTVQGGFALQARDLAVINQNVSAQGCETREAIAASTTAILQKIDQNTIDDLRHSRDAALRAVEVNALRSQVEVNQTVTTTQAQAQAQFQVQTQGQEILHRLHCLEGGHNQLATAVNRTIQFGTGNVSANHNSANNAQ